MVRRSNICAEVRLGDRRCFSGELFFSLPPLLKLLMLLLVSFFVIRSAYGQPKVITIGGIFEQDYEQQVGTVLRRAADIVNTIPDLLPVSCAPLDLLPGIKLVVDVEFVPAHDSFAASRSVCRLLRDGVAAIIGPVLPSTADHVQSICDAVEVPHIRTQWDPDWAEGGDAGSSGVAGGNPIGPAPSTALYSVNLYPHYANLSRAFIDFIIAQDWQSFAILYDSDEGLLRMQRLLRATRGRPDDFVITVRHLEQNPDEPNDFRATLKDIRNRGEAHIILDCDWHKAKEVLRQAMSINMTRPYYHYMLTTLDVELVDLDIFRKTGVNITAFRLVSNPASNSAYTQTVSASATGGVRTIDDAYADRRLSTDDALLYDAVHLFAAALTELSRARDVRTASLSCDKPRPWEHGSSLINYMKTAQIEGLSGNVRFDERGKRSTFGLDLVEFTIDGLEKIGSWSPSGGIAITKNYSEALEEVAGTLRNKMLTVTTLLEEPYVMLKPDPEGKLRGNSRFHGFCVDLLDEISKIFQFNYTLKPVEDGKYGAPVGHRDEWNGMVRELMDKKADLAVAALTISFIREQVIDFTKPFMTLGISIMFKKPERKNPGLFSFMSPLSFEIWIYMLIAYLIVSFSLFVLARFSPYEWYNPHPCNPNCEVVENQFTLINSLWFCVGSLMQQGSEVAPRAVSTRMVSGTWWFFTLILISSYTANLAAFLTVERMKSPIESAEDLAKQTAIKYGPLYGGSTMTFFKTSRIESYARMWKAMQEFTPSAFVNSTPEGIERVKKGQYAFPSVTASAPPTTLGQYAFLLESRMIEYIVQRSCDLMQVGGLLDSKGYGIGTPRGSPYRDLISDAILKLQEDQMLQMMYDKWWKEPVE